MLEIRPPLPEKEPAMNAPLEQIKQCLQRGQSDLIGSHGVLVGVDLGSYGLRALAADLHGNRVVADQRPLPDGTPDEIVAQALELVRDVLEEGGWTAQQLVRIGIGFGGPVDADAGLTRLSHRMPGWEQYPVVARFEEALGATALLGNDANVTALGEASCGIGHDVRNLFYLHLSTGVGGGLVLDKRLYSGATTTAGEIGHATVRRDGPRCSCGGYGHLEAYVSIDSLLRRAGELGLHTDDLQHVFDGNEIGRQTVTEAVGLLGLALGNVVTLLDPNMIVLGGTVTRIGGEPLLQMVREQLDASLPPSLRRSVPVVASTFGIDSVAVGALALAMQSLGE
jgi:glucokinase